MNSEELPYLKRKLQWFVGYIMVLNVTSLAIPVEKCDVRCACTKESMTCKMYMPYTLPYGIQSLTVEGNPDETNVTQFWMDGSWRRLKSLTLQNFAYHSFSEVYKFRNLMNLEYFGLHSPDFDQLENEQLKAMPNLKYLNLSLTKRLRFPTIISALAEGNLPNLEELDLDSVASDPTYTTMNIFDGSFINVLMGKPLRKLIVTNTMLEIDATMLFNDSIPTLEFLNISGPWLPSRRQTIPADICENACIKTLDLSVSMISIFKTGEDVVIKDEYNSDSCVIYPFIKLLFSTTNVYLNDVVEIGVTFTNITYNLTSCLVASNLKRNIRTLHLHNNGLESLDIKFVDDLDIGLTYLDLSSNLLEFIAPDFFKVMGSLSTLNLSDNYFCEMELNSEFSFVLMHLKSLETVILSINQLTIIPRNIFIQNKNLIEIDLSDNMLSNVDFTIRHLHRLKVLNLADNYIKFLESAFLQQLDRLSIYPAFQTSYSHTATGKVVILTDNPLRCSCDSVTFLNWLISRYNTTERDDPITCLFEDENTKIDEEVEAKSKYLCVKAAVTIAVCTTVVTLALAAIGLLCVCYVRYRRRVNTDRITKMIRELREQLLYKYLIFLSYCSDDEEIVLDNIYPKLSKEVCTRVGYDGDLICVGNLKFRPGFPIHEEMVKCISESCVVVFIVSSAFCKSGWCNTEVQEAATQNKPIILFLVDDVDERLMQPYLRTLFHRYTRVKLSTNTDRHVEFQPDIQTVSQSLLQLAADNQKYGGFYEILIRRLRRRKGVCC